MLARDEYIKVPHEALKFLMNTCTLSRFVSKTPSVTLNIKILTFQQQYIANFDRGISVKLLHIFLDFALSFHQVAIEISSISRNRKKCKTYFFTLILTVHASIITLYCKSHS